MIGATKSTNRNSRSCKKCGHYDSKIRHCKSFNISVSSTGNAKYCKTYNEVTKSIPKNQRYKHSSSKMKYNKYNTK